MDISMIKRQGMWLCCLLTVLWTACSSPKKTTERPQETASLSFLKPVKADSLTAGAQRKFDMFFMEALRSKEKGDEAAAFDLYAHCLHIQPHSSAVHFELANLYDRLGNDSLTLSHLEMAAAIEPSNYWYLQTLGDFYLNARKTDRAIAVYEYIAAHFPDKENALAGLLQLYNEKADYPNAIKTLSKFEEIEGVSEQTTMEKVRLYVLMKQMDKAYSMVRELCQKNPNDLRYSNLLAGMYLDHNETAKGLAVIDSILKIDSANAPARLSLASYYEKNGKDSLYQQEVDKVLMNPSLEPDARLNVMRTLIAKSEQRQGKDSLRLMDLFQRQLRMKQENADLAMLCAQYMVTKHKPQKDIEPVLKQILALNPENLPARLQLLSYYAKENATPEDYENIVQICIPATVYNPTELPFYYYLSIAYSQTNRKEKALEMLEKGTKQVSPKSKPDMVSDMYGMMGDLYFQLKRKTEAYAAYDSSLVYKDNNIMVLNNYAYYLSLEGKRLDKAEEMSYRTIKAEPNNPTYLDTYAWILFEKGKYTEACTYIDQALKNGGDTQSAVMEHAGDIYFKAGKRQEALACWKKALKLGPDEEIRKTKLKQKIRLKKYIKG